MSSARWRVCGWRRFWARLWPVFLLGSVRAALEPTTATRTVAPTYVNNPAGRIGAASNSNSASTSMTEDFAKMTKEAGHAVTDRLGPSRVPQPDVEEDGGGLPFLASRKLRDGVWEDEGPLWFKELIPRPSRPPVAQAAPLFTQRLDGDINAQYRPPQSAPAVHSSREQSIPHIYQSTYGGQVVNNQYPAQPLLEGPEPPKADFHNPYKTPFPPQPPVALYTPQGQTNPKPLFVVSEGPRRPAQVYQPQNVQPNRDVFRPAPGNSYYQPSYGGSPYNPNPYAAQNNINPAAAGGYNANGQRPPSDTGPYVPSPYSPSGRGLGGSREYNGQAYPPAANRPGGENGNSAPNGPWSRAGEDEGGQGGSAGHDDQERRPVSGGQGQGGRQGSGGQGEEGYYGPGGRSRPGAYEASGSGSHGQGGQSSSGDRGQSPSGGRHTAGYYEGHGDQSGSGSQGERSQSGPGEYEGPGSGSHGQGGPPRSGGQGEGAQSGPGGYEGPGSGSHGQGGPLRSGGQGEGAQAGSGGYEGPGSGSHGQGGPPRSGGQGEGSQSGPGGYEGPGSGSHGQGGPPRSGGQGEGARSRLDGQYGPGGKLGEDGREGQGGQGQGGQVGSEGQGGGAGSGGHEGGQSGPGGREGPDEQGYEGRPFGQGGEGQRAGSGTGQYEPGGKQGAFREQQRPRASEEFYPTGSHEPGYSSESGGPSGPGGQSGSQRPGGLGSGGSSEYGDHGQHPRVNGPGYSAEGSGGNGQRPAGQQSSGGRTGSPQGKTGHSESGERQGLKNGSSSGGQYGPGGKPGADRGGQQGLGGRSGVGPGGGSGAGAQPGVRQSGQGGPGGQRGSSEFRGQVHPPGTHGPGYSTDSDGLSVKTGGSHSPGEQGQDEGGRDIGRGTAPGGEYGPGGQPAQRGHGGQSQGERGIGGNAGPGGQTQRQGQETQYGPGGEGHGRQGHGGLSGSGGGSGRGTEYGPGGQIGQGPASQGQGEKGREEQQGIGGAGPGGEYGPGGQTAPSGLGEFGAGGQQGARVSSGPGGRGQGEHSGSGRQGLGGGAGSEGGYGPGSQGSGQKQGGQGRPGQASQGGSGQSTGSQGGQGKGSEGQGHGGRGGNGQSGGSPWTSGFNQQQGRTEPGQQGPGYPEEPDVPNLSRRGQSGQNQSGSPWVNGPNRGQHGSSGQSAGQANGRGDNGQNDSRDGSNQNGANGQFGPNNSNQRSGSESGYADQSRTKPKSEFTTPSPVGGSYESGASPNSRTNGKFVNPPPGSNKHDTASQTTGSGPSQQPYDKSQSQQNPDAPTPPTEQLPYVAIEPLPPPGERPADVVQNRVRGKARVICHETGIDFGISTIFPFTGQVFANDKKRVAACTHSFSAAQHVNVSFAYAECGVPNPGQFNGSVQAASHIQVIVVFAQAGGRTSVQSYMAQCAQQRVRHATRDLPKRIEEALQELSLLPTKLEQRSAVPACEMRLLQEAPHQLDADGADVERAGVGQPLRLEWALRPESDAYGLLVRNCIIRDLVSGAEHVVVDERGCSTDLNILAHPHYDTYHDVVRASLSAFKLPDHTRFNIRCETQVCSDIKDENGANSCEEIMTPPYCPDIITSPQNSVLFDGPSNHVHRVKREPRLEVETSKQPLKGMMTKKLVMDVQVQADLCLSNESDPMCAEGRGNMQQTEKPLRLYCMSRLLLGSACGLSIWSVIFAITFHVYRAIRSFR